MVIPSYREEELAFARKKLYRKIKEYQRNSGSALPINYSDIRSEREESTVAKTIYDLKKAGKYEEIGKLALECFKKGDEKNGEKYLATLYTNSPEYFENTSRKLQHLGIHYPVFGPREPLIRHD
ncbi:MAG: hypothetical protein ACPL06_02335 [Candidatus Anstonellales archaeon]